MRTFKKLISNELNRIELKNQDQYDLLILKLKHFNQLLFFYEFIKTDVQYTIKDPYHKILLLNKIDQIEALLMQQC